MADDHPLDVRVGRLRAAAALMRAGEMRAPTPEFLDGTADDLEYYGVPKAVLEVLEQAFDDLGMINVDHPPYEPIDGYELVQEWREGRAGSTKAKEEPLL